MAREATRRLQCGGAELSEAVVGRDHSARGGVAGGAGEGGERDGERKRVGRRLLELKTSRYGSLCSKFPRYKTKHA
jgi:hypothetical protein